MHLLHSISSTVVKLHKLPISTVLTSMQATYVNQQQFILFCDKMRTV